MEELLLEFDDIRITRTARKNATALERWTLSTQGLSAAGHAEIVVNCVPDELCEPLSKVLQQLCDYVKKGHKFAARDQMNLGLGRVTFRKFRQGHIELVDDHAAQSEDDEVPPATQFLLALAIDAGWFYFRHHGFDAGLRFFQVALAYDKKSIGALHGTGLCNARLGELLSATQALDQAIEVSEKSFDQALPQLLFQRALLYHERALGELESGHSPAVSSRLIDQTLSDYRASLKWEQTAEVYFHRARTHRLRGDDNSAEQDIQHILALNPRLNPSALRIAVTESHRRRQQYIGLDPSEQRSLREIMEEFD